MKTRTETEQRVRKLVAQYKREARSEWQKSRSAEAGSWRQRHHEKMAFHAMGAAHGARMVAIVGSY